MSKNNERLPDPGHVPSVQPTTEYSTNGSLFLPPHIHSEKRVKAKPHG
jgi:hypothetical protein